MRGQPRQYLQQLVLGRPVFFVDDDPVRDADSWQEQARRHEGSWWTDWGNWLKGYLGPEVPPRMPGKGKLKVIEPAPGSYARIRAE